MEFKRPVEEESQKPSVLLLETSVKQWVPGRRKTGESRQNGQVRA